MSHTSLDGHQSEAEEEMPYCTSGMARCRFVYSLSLPITRLLMYHLQDFLQEQLTRETSRPEFSRLPFRFAEIAKVILDVLANTFLYVVAVSDFHQVPQMMYRMQTKSSRY